MNETTIEYIFKYEVPGEGEFIERQSTLNAVIFRKREILSNPCFRPNQEPIDLGIYKVTTIKEIVLVNDIFE